MARNSLYSNSPYSSRMGGGWIYSDGELYHYGRKGMKWYKTIFGGYDNPKSFTYDPDRGKFDNFKGQLSTGWQNVKGFASNAKKNFNRYYGTEAKQRMTIKGAHNYNNADWRGYKRDNPGEIKGKNGWSMITTSHLEEYMAKQIRDGNAVADDILTNPSILNKLNMVFQNTQFRVAYNVNNMLKKMGLDDEVDDLISKFTGEESGYGKMRRMQAHGSELNNTIQGGNSYSKSQAYENAIRRSNPDPNAPAPGRNPAPQERASATAEYHSNPNKYAGAGRLTGKSKQRVIEDIYDDAMKVMSTSGWDGVDEFISNTARTSGLSEKELYRYFMDNANKNVNKDDDRKA